MQCRLLKIVLASRHGGRDLSLRDFRREAFDGAMLGCRIKRSFRGERTRRRISYSTDCGLLANQIEISETEHHRLRTDAELFGKFPDLRLIVLIDRVYDLDLVSQ